MKYFNWQSDDYQILVHKFNGVFTSDFFELVDSFVYNFETKNNQLIVITDLSEADLSKLTEKEVTLLSESFINSVPRISNIKYCLILGSFDRPDIHLLKPYSHLFEKNEAIDFHSFEDLETTCKSLNIFEAYYQQIHHEISEWKK